MSTASAITLSWTTDGENVRGSVVSWEVSSGNGGSSARTVQDDDSGMSLVLDDTSYTIENLRSSTTYRITVTVINPAGNVSSSFTHATAEGTPVLYRLVVF